MSRALIQGENDERTGTCEHHGARSVDAGALLTAVFGWQVRWKGGNIRNGISWHVGGQDDYVALYAPPKQTEAAAESSCLQGGFDNVGFMITVLDSQKARAKEAGSQVRPDT